MLTRQVYFKATELTETLNNPTDNNYCYHRRLPFLHIIVQIQNQSVGVWSLPSVRTVQLQLVLLLQLTCYKYVILSH